MLVGMIESPESKEDHCTLYVRGLNNDRVKKAQMLRNLHMLFSRHGKVAQIRAGVGVKGKGQAWIKFSSEESAAEAMGRQGQLVCGHPITIAYAMKVKSSVKI